MKKIKVFLLTLFVALSGICLAGCDAGGSETYKVEFIIDNKVNSTKDVLEGNKVSEPVAPSKTGYNFVGWYNGEVKFDFNSKVKGELDLVAKFELIKYDLTLDLMGGQVDDNFSASSTYTIEDTITLPTPTRSYHVFLGWQESGKEEILATVELNKSTGNKSYVAVWGVANMVPLYIDNALYKSMPVALDSKVLEGVENLDETTTGWFKDPELSQPVLDTDIVTQSMRLYARRYSGTNTSIFSVSEGIVFVDADSSWNGVIPKKIDGEVITKIAEVVVAQTTKIYLPSSVVSIDSNCLTSYAELANMPNTITSIGDLDVEVKSMSSIVIKNNNTSISDSAFAYMKNLTSIEIEEGTQIETIGAYAFLETSIETITIPSSVTAIGAGAFFGTNLETITIPAAVKTIGASAFSIDTLTSVAFENNSQLETIKRNVFLNSKIETITIPKTVTTIGDDVFPSTLTSVTFETGSQLGAIGAELFKETKIQTIRIPATVTVIGDNAFPSTLTSVTFESGSKLETIGASAFKGTGIQSINIPSSVTKINTSAFEDCHLLTSVAFGSNSLLQEIGIAAFRNTGIQTITIPANVELINAKAFELSKQLTSIEFESGAKLKRIGSEAFKNTGIQTITIPRTVTIIESAAFYLSKLTNVTFEVDSQLTTLNTMAFADTNLENIIIPINVKYIYNNVFDDDVIVVVNTQTVYELIKENVLDVDEIHVLKILTGTNSYLDQNYEKVDCGNYYFYIKNK